MIAKSHWGRETATYMNNTLHVCTATLCLGPSIKKDTLSFRRCCRESKRCPKSSFIWPDSAKIADYGVTHDQFVTHTVNKNLISSSRHPPTFQQNQLKWNRESYQNSFVIPQVLFLWDALSPLEGAKSLGTRTLSLSS